MDFDIVYVQGMNYAGSRFLWIPLKGEVGCLIGSQGLHSLK